MEGYPSEIILCILEYVDVDTLRNVRLVSRALRDVATHNVLWRKITPSRVICLCRPRTNLSLFNSYVKQYRRGWCWDTCDLHRSPFIRVNGRFASRQEPATYYNRGCNCAVLADRPITAKRNSFTVMIMERGTWISIGVACRHVRLENDLMLGKQTMTSRRCFNAGYTCQVSQCINHVSGCAPHLESVGVGRALLPGDRVTITLDGCQVTFRRNNDLVGSATLRTRNGCPIYPCVMMSAGTRVLLHAQ